MKGRDWRVAIADDEPTARRGVRQFLARYRNFCVVAECRNGDEVLSVLDVLYPDVLFLDVQMPGLSGLDAVRRRPVHTLPLIIFLTAYNEFATEAFEVEAVDYLIKPVSEERFAVAMERIERRLAEPRQTLQRHDAVLVSTSSGVTVVPIDDIEWIEAANNYACIWTGGKSFLIREAMHDLESRVRDHGFMRAHRRALVPIRRIRELTWSSDGQFVAVLTNGMTIPIARRRRAAIAAALRTLRK